jgi:hypothetical protein
MSMIVKSEPQLRAHYRYRTTTNNKPASGSSIAGAQLGLVAFLIELQILTVSNASPMHVQAIKSIARGCTVNGLGHASDIGQEMLQSKCQCCDTSMHVCIHLFFPSRSQGASTYQVLVKGVAKQGQQRVVVDLDGQSWLDLSETIKYDTSVSVSAVSGRGHS